MKSKSFILIFFLNIVLTFNCFGQIVRYTTSNLTFRKGPSTGYAVLETVPAGTKVTIEDYNYYENDWLEVVYNGQIGYISTKYLSSQRELKAKSSSTTWTSNSYNKSSNTYGGNRGYYTNVDGNRIPRPHYSNSTPSGATAICWDGTYSYSAHRRGTCSHHGGVKVWLN